MLRLIGFRIAGPAVRVLHHFHANLPLPPPPDSRFFVFLTCKTLPPSIMHTHAQTKNKIARRMQALPCATLSALSFAISNFLKKKAKWQHFLHPFLFLAILEACICRCILHNCLSLPPQKKCNPSSPVPPPPKSSRCFTRTPDPALIARLQSICTGRFKPHYVCFKITRSFFFF